MYLECLRMETLDKWKPEILSSKNHQYGKNTMMARDKIT